MRPSISHSPLARAVLRPRDPVTELMIMDTIVLLAVPLLFWALARLLI